MAARRACSPERACIASTVRSAPSSSPDRVGRMVEGVGCGCCTPATRTRRQRRGQRIHLLRHATRGRHPWRRTPQEPSATGRPPPGVLSDPPQQAGAAPWLHPRGILRRPRRPVRHRFLPTPRPKKKIVLAQLVLKCMNGSSELPFFLCLMHEIVEIGLTVIICAQGWTNGFVVDAIRPILAYRIN